MAAVSVAAIVAACALPTLPASSRPTVAPPIAGMAIDVQDGDSFTLRADDGRRLRIRVSGIDAPERGQPWADASRRALGEQLRGRRLLVDPIKQDRYDRTVARVRVPAPDGGEVDAGLAQIEAGLAWHFARYRSDQPEAEADRYARAERDARARRAGLWQDPAPEAPWDFRSRIRRGEAAPARRPPPSREG